ncbi:MAG: hypothetical protein HKN29_13385, partial [Rhodothermales bacterium]|nr:hypothetical protein [Rhodothermales bacterium]
MDRIVWRASLAALVLAAATGTALRGMLHLGWPLPFELENVRHAHSHLMYFAWVTPALVLLIYRRLGLDPPTRILAVLLVLGFASYVPFLLTGYAFAQMGSMRLPISISISTSALIAWYFAVAHYRRARRTSPNAFGRPFFDAAFALLVLASLGAWGLGIIQAIDPPNPVWFQTSLHLFLDGFAMGWLMLGVLGLA